MPKQQTKTSRIQDLLAQAESGDSPEEALDAILQTLTDTAENLHQRLLAVMAERDQLLEQRDLVIHKSVTLRAAVKALIADWDAMIDMPEGGVDATQFDQRLQAVRELVEGH